MPEDRSVYEGASGPLDDLVDVTQDGPHVDWDPHDRESHLRRLWAQVERAVESRDHLLLEAACAALRALKYGRYLPEQTEDDGEV